MRKKLITMLTITTMTLSLLVGCGQQATPNTNEDTSTEQNTEVEVVEPTATPEVEPTMEPVVEPTTEPEVEDPVVEPTEEPTIENGEDEFYSDSYQWAFPEGLDGFTDKFVIASDETMSFNCTHYVDINGNEMNFSWVGPTALGEKASTYKNTLTLYDSAGEYALRAFTTGELSPETYDELKSYVKETIISFAAPETPYIPDGYYNANIGDNYMSYTYAIAGDISGNAYKGYEHYICDRENGLCYQFSYLENVNIYDDTRAMNVIDSIDFWDYIPEE